MTRDIDNSQDILDSRDVIERIEELEAERSDLADALDDADEDEKDAERGALEAWDEENGAELAALKALADECEGCADWQYGETLIREDYFTQYAREMLEDCGDLPRDLPHYIEIDWDATARNIRMDYTSVDFNGVEYWIRS